ncbi:hypothetical protein BC936DRAFT_138132 [Jimgerdemannia flammicorona]|uniref:Proline dehydrogenase n=1 Tax=Jimgerdemannia flammicorona TaxID=994334 RepID=A0A433DIK1_9FUNG|nr:hypothetical protein BC936DRAFT_138132 [Jimgerdemannia flammicorona]
MLPLLTAANRTAIRAPLHLLRVNPARSLRPTATYTTLSAQNKPLVWSNFAYAAAFTGVASASLLYSLKTPTKLESPQPISAFVNSNASATIAELNDDNNRIAVRSKSAPELILSMAVYRVCTMTWLVDLAPHIIELAEKIHVSGPIYWVVRRTFFRQFCGGESADDCVGTMEKLKTSGIGSILDLSIEADLEISAADPATTRARYNQQADRVLDLTKTCLETARSQPNSFAAIKITAFAPPSFLQDMTIVLQFVRDAFHRADADADGRIRFAEFRDIVRSMPGSSTIDADSLAAKLFAQSDADNDGMIDFLEFSETFSIDSPAVKPLFVSAKGLTPDHIEDYDRMMDRLYDLCNYARANNVRLMVDAEQSYFQRTIDHVAMKLEKEYNRKENPNGPVIFNTCNNPSDMFACSNLLSCLDKLLIAIFQYFFHVSDQMYLKEALSKLRMDVERAKRGGFVFGAKLVRGAYMVSERKVGAPVLREHQKT